MTGDFRLGTIAGIGIDVHYTWLFAFALITATLSSSWFPSAYPDWSGPTYWLTGAASALLLFASVLVHEFAHSLVALSKGMPVRSITLFIFGGMSNIGGESRSARDEFQIAIVGPASSLALAAVCVAALRTGLTGDDSPVEAVVIYLTIVNLLVGVFNLLPGFPLDGGRVLRSIVWRVTGSESRATEIAATVGIGFGWLMIALGAVSAVTGSIVTGLWTAFIGWYLKDAAQSVRSDSRGRSLREVPVRAVMSPPGRVVAPEVSVAVLVDDFMVPYGRRSVPVVDGAVVAGIITLEDVQRVRRDLWAVTPVSAVMTRPPLFAVGPDDPMRNVLAIIASQRINQVLVIEGERLTGVVTRADAARFMQVRDALAGMR